MTSSRRTLESRAIWTALRETRVLPEFQEEHIPPLAQHYEVHKHLHKCLTHRLRTEVLLENVLSERAVYGSPLDPNRDFEDDYHRLSQQYDDLNRAM
jgi:hypothetical protein